MTQKHTLIHHIVDVVKFAHGLCTTSPKLKRFDMPPRTLRQFEKLGEFAKLIVELQAKMQRIPARVAVGHEYVPPPTVSARQGVRTAGSVRKALNVLVPIVRDAERIEDVEVIREAFPEAELDKEHHRPEDVLLAVRQHC